MGALELAMAAPSLGGVETLVSQPRYTSHVGLTDAQREAQGIPDGFVRISVGVENVEDLQADLQRALEAAG
jgi:cystathionine beta-lyase/cystathionine gamma-synthase